MKPAIILGLVCSVSAFPAEPRKGTAERIKVHGRSLEGNLSGDPADRDVSIWLPPSYAMEKSRRYPVLYFLHGFTDSDEKWFWNEKHFVNLPKALDASIARGAAEMIVVMPNAFTRIQGSFYSNSVTTGDWESFVARELVAYVDGHYRTLPARESRGLAGHSMGGYGTMRIGMKNPDVFSSIYMLNPCCMSPGFMGAENLEALERVKTADEIAKLSFMEKAWLAGAAAWAPSPKNPPMYLDRPVAEEKAAAEVRARWGANAPLAIVDQYITSLRRMKGIGVDAGDKEAAISRDARALHEKLDAYGVAHEFEIYEGNHTNRVAEQIEKRVMPFFTRTLRN